jgi:hypothetical protein
MYNTVLAIIKQLSIKVSFIAESYRQNSSKQLERHSKVNSRHEGMLLQPAIPAACPFKEIIIRSLGISEIYLLFGTVPGNSFISTLLGYMAVSVRIPNINNYKLFRYL